MQDKTIDEALIECMRTMKALKALRKIRQQNKAPRLLSHTTQMMGGIPADVKSFEFISTGKARAAALRATLDLTRKLADLRQGR